MSEVEAPLKGYDDYTADELDAIVEEMKKPIMNLEAGLAQTLMTHVGFEGIVTQCLARGINKYDDILEFINGAFEAFWSQNKPEEYQKRVQ